MTVVVRIPTILRSYTDGAKAVEGRGETLADVLDSVETSHPGIRDQIVERSELRRFINIYVNDEDVRFLGGLQTSLKDGDVVVVLPAVAGGQ
jgi:sulfur-carrier protein